MSERPVLLYTIEIHYRGLDNADRKTRAIAPGRTSTEAIETAKRELERIAKPQFIAKTNVLGASSVYFPRVPV